ncbi:MAG: glycosyltransferase [Eudoraea sp.]|nr:glycosyltransferase [Eudoraea sp.]
MRIFLISNMYPSSKDALFGVFVKNFRAELEKQGVHFSKLALIKGKAYSPIKKIFNYLLHYGRILVLSLSKEYDLIYVHYLSHHIPVLFPIALLSKKPLVINIHGSDLIGWDKKPIFRFFTKKILERCRLLVVPTVYFKDTVLEMYPSLSVDQIYVSPSGGIDRSIFYHKEEPSKESSICLGFVSRFIAEKGWQTFLESLIKLRAENIPFKALMAGKGPDELKIRDFISTQGLEKSVDFIGLVPQSKLVDVYNQLDLYIFPTYRAAESLGLTGLEAMSCGVPVVGCNIAGPSTYIKNGYNGFFFEAKNADDLFNCIRDYFYLNEIDKKLLSQNAVQTAVAYDKTVVAENLLVRLKKIFS